MRSLRRCATTLGVARRVGFAVVGALAGLHLVDYASCGLSDLGRPDGFVARQVRGWRSRWDPVARDDANPVMLEVADLLERTLPRPQRAAVLHNDLKLDNCQFDPADPDRVRSVFDWDMATLGDPLVDLGTLLNYWPDPSDEPGDRGVYPDGQDALGLPSQEVILAVYADATGLDLAAQLVPGLRLLEDGDRAAATAQPLPARRNGGRAHGQQG